MGDRARPDHTLTVQPPASATAFVVGTDDGRYAIVSELARGGAGRIAVAVDRKLGRRVALKRALDRSGHARLEREALVLAKLEHPAIVPIHDTGHDATGAPYFAMKLVAGVELTAKIDAATTFEQRLALLAPITAVADAIAYAHSEHVIHRDLKPSNVLVGEFGEIAVIDWGLGKLLGEADDIDAGTSPTDSSLTRTGSVMGTPAYMAPEQARGEVLDERADVYALGAILYHALVGEAPYGDSSSAATLARLVDGPAPEPAEQREPRIPRDLAAIIATAIAHSPKDRYASARELVDDLHRYQAGRLVAAHRYSMWTRARRWFRRRRTELAVAAAACIAIVAAVGLVVIRGAAADDLHSAQIETQRAADEVRAKELQRATAEAQKAAADAERVKAESRVVQESALVDESHDALEAKTARLEAALREATEARDRADRASRAAEAAASEARRANAELKLALDRERARAEAAESKKKNLATQLR
jgi:hypothetical protein